MYRLSALIAGETQIGAGVRCYHGYIASGARVADCTTYPRSRRSGGAVLGAELAFDIFLVLNGGEVRLVMEPV